MKHGITAKNGVLIILFLLLAFILFPLLLLHRNIYWFEAYDGQLDWEHVGDVHCIARHGPHFYDYCLNFATPEEKKREEIHDPLDLDLRTFESRFKKYESYIIFKFPPSPPLFSGGRSALIMSPDKNESLIILVGRPI